MGVCRVVAAGRSVVEVGVIACVPWVSAHGTSMESALRIGNFAAGCRNTRGVVPDLRLHLEVKEPFESA